MDLIGEKTKEWAKERWDELLRKLPNLDEDRTDALICALGDIGTGLKGIAEFLKPRNGGVTSDRPEGRE